jgi:hypothetical protein
MNSFKAGRRTSIRTGSALALAVLMSALVVMAALSPPSGAGGGSVGTPTYTVTVTKSGTGSGTVRSQLAGILCGDACSADFPLGNPVTLAAESSRGSRFKGWDGTVKGSARTILVPSSSDGTPIAVEATFDRALRPVVKLPGKPLDGKPLPRRLGLKLDCRADVPCRLQVRALLGIWASRKGYDYYQASSAVYSPPGGGTEAWSVSVPMDKASPQLFKRFSQSYARSRRAAIRIEVKDLETGLGMAIQCKHIRRCREKEMAG